MLKWTRKYNYAEALEHDESKTYSCYYGEKTIPVISTDINSGENAPDVIARVFTAEKLESFYVVIDVKQHHYELPKGELYHDKQTINHSFWNYIRHPEPHRQLAVHCEWTDKSHYILNHLDFVKERVLAFIDKEIKTFHVKEQAIKEVEAQIQAIDFDKRIAHFTFLRDGLYRQLVDLNENEVMSTLIKVLRLKVGDFVKIYYRLNEDKTVYVGLEPIQDSQNISEKFKKESELNIF